MTRHRSGKAKVAVFFLVAIFALAVASSATLVHAQTGTFQYEFLGPFFLNGAFATGNSVTCTLLWSNYTTNQITFSTAGPYDILTSNNGAQIMQILWNSSSALNETSFIALPQLANGGVSIPIDIYIPNPTLPSALYTFSVTDFVGMTNAYLEMVVNNATGGVSSSIAEEVSLNSTANPVFLMTQYYTYTLTFTCDQGTYSQQFTAESTTTSNLIVLAGAFPTTNSTTPVADAERLNSSLIGITYVDPSNSTASLSVLITHQSGSTTIYDYSNTAMSNAETILWDDADPNTSYNVNVTSTIGTTPYIWILVVPSSALNNPWTGAWDWLGQSVPTMPYVTTGWPLDMTSNDIAEIVGGLIILFFLSIGSFRSSGPVCIIAWIMSGFLIYFGWWGNGTTGALSAIPEFALSGFLAIMIQIDEAKQVVRED